MYCNIIIHVEARVCVCVSLVIPDICMNLSIMLIIYMIRFMCANAFKALRFIFAASEFWLQLLFALYVNLLGKEGGGMMPRGHVEN